jgi:hypothetical protein
MIDWFTSLLWRTIDSCRPTMERSLRLRPYSLGPKATEWSEPIEIPASVATDALKGKQIIFIWGRATYNGIFDDTPEHFTQWCYKLVFPRTTPRPLTQFVALGHITVPTRIQAINNRRLITRRTIARPLLSFLRSDQGLISASTSSLSIAAPILTRVSNCASAAPESSSSRATQS